MTHDNEEPSAASAGSKPLTFGSLFAGIGGFDLGPAAAFSIVYFLIILFLSWLFYTLMMREEAK